MVKRRAATVDASESWTPVPEDELDLAAKEEIAARVARLKPGDRSTTSHEEFMREMGFEDLLDQE